MEDVRIRPAGDAALRIELPEQLDEATSARTIALAAGVSSGLSGTLRDVVVGYHTVTVYFDPMAVDALWLEERLWTIAGDPGATAAPASALIDVPVCYGGELGPDLASVAGMCGCSERQVIEMHAAREYRVFVVGFVPGFAYMGTLDQPLAEIPRRATPRTRVPPGSVAIAAGQTGIYPIETPGGWHLLGRTPVRPFDESRPRQVLFRPGDRVRFHEIDRAEFDRLSG
jgi:KipI family sensor histidine kinase inhibitor